MTHRHRKPPRGEALECKLADGTPLAAVWNGLRFVPLYNPCRWVHVASWRRAAEVCKAARLWAERQAA